MANQYNVSASDLIARYDVRSLFQLSNDDDTQNENVANIQIAIDDSASELDAIFTNRIGLPLPLPVANIVYRLICIPAVAALYGRRGDLPADIEKQVEWRDKWLDDFRMGKVTVPGAGGRNTMQLTQSDSFCQGSITNQQPFFPSKGPGIPFFDGAINQP